MSKPKKPKRRRFLRERKCTCTKCGKVCNSTPDTTHRRCGGEWK